jgi:long-chain acyl-CoA synthetase
LNFAILFQVYDGVMKNVATQSPLKQSAFKLAIGIARERNHAMEFGLPVSPFLAWKHKIADKVVLSKIRERLGGRLRSVD